MILFSALAKGKDTKAADKVVEQREEIRIEEDATKAAITALKEDIKNADPEDVKGLEKVRMLRKAIEQLKYSNFAKFKALSVQKMWQVGSNYQTFISVKHLNYSIFILYYTKCLSLDQADV